CLRSRGCTSSPAFRATASCTAPSPACSWPRSSSTARPRRWTSPSWPIPALPRGASSRNTMSSEQERAIRSRVQAQFGDKADAYATSAIHADPAHLVRLLELVQPQPDWRVLDVATGAGHTAHALARHVASVVATDLTPPMVAKARALAQEKGLANVSARGAGAGALPSAPASSDLVTVRLAPHHCPDIGRFLAEVHRILPPGGRLTVVDNVVPGSLHSGKKARLQNEAGRYINAFERLRGPSHARSPSLYARRHAFIQPSLAIEQIEGMSKRRELRLWAASMGVIPQ